jgi:hypothetical protein
MPSRPSLRTHLRALRRLVVASGGALAVLIALSQAALAQESLNPTVTPVKDTGGWVYWMAEGAIALGVLILLLAGFAYLRFAPRFSHEDEDVQRPRAGVRAPEPQLSLQTVWTQSSPVAAEPVPAPSAVSAPQPATVAAPAAAPAQAAAPAATAPAPASPAAEGQPAPAAAPASPAAPRPKAEPVELDQETFDRVLQEQLAKGTDRRVAEGRARSAAMKAARAKAEGS